VVERKWQRLKWIGAAGRNMSRKLLMKNRHKTDIKPT